MKTHTILASLALVFACGCEGSDAALDADAASDAVTEGEPAADAPAETLTDPPPDTGGEPDAAADPDAATDPDGDHVVILEHVISRLYEPARWPISGGIHAEYLAVEDVPDVVFENPDLHYYLFFDYFTADIPFSPTFEFFLYTLSETPECWLDVMDVVTVSPVLVEGVILDETRPGGPLLMETAVLYGAGLYPTDELMGVNLFDITDSTATACGGYVRDHISGDPHGGETDFMYGGYNAIIRDMRIYVGRPAP
ncbi:MAG: hypothetical protein JRG91_01660 [Deltaproteobacteria bacterium]|nr:hypothetical protein [Deltaproteobacteria bacterium]